MKKRILSVLLTISYIIGLMPTTAFASPPIKVLALGDSITAGFGLQHAETERFTALLGDNYIVTNKAVNGNTSANIINQLENGVISTELITSADIITITIGGNDMMALLHAKIAEKYNAENNSNLTANDVNRILTELNQNALIQNYSLLHITAELLSENSTDYLINSQEFTTALNIYQNTLIKITTLLKKANPDAKIIIATQFNPYTEFEANSIFSSFYNGIEECIGKLNETIVNGSAANGYMIANVKTAFDAKHSNETDLYNADPDIASINFDFHPNANGHIVLAEVFRTAIEKVNYDKNTTHQNPGTFEDISTSDYFFEAVNWAINNDLTAGTSATTFSPDTSCTRGQVMTFLWRAAGSPAPKNTKMPFIDVPADFYYHDAILWAIENGITAGTSDTTFSPDAKCSRAQIATILWRAQKAPVVSGTNPFNDIAVDSYYNNAVLWATSEKITSGTSAITFSPDADCTRAQIVTFLWRFLNHN